MMRSLQARLGIGMVVSVVVLFAAQWWVVNDALRGLTESYFASRLEHDLEGLLASLTFDAEGHADLNTTHPEPNKQQPKTNQNYQVQARDQTIRSRSLWDDTLTVPDVGRGGRRIVHTVGPQRQGVIMLVAGFEKGGHQEKIAMAEDYTPVFLFF